MKFYQEWTGVAINENVEQFCFPANVPGNIQDDFAIAKDLGDMNYGKNCMQYCQMEGYTWKYISNLKFDKKSDERVFFVSEGIDYGYSIFINDIELLKSEGMFSKIELDITDYLKEENILTVTIFPHPKRENADKNTSREADSIVKPPVHYGWDWHPRLLVSGMWQEAYIETRNNEYINDYYYNYIISDDYSQAVLNFEIDCNVDAVVELFDREGNTIYKGNGKNIIVDNLKLWWCNGHGDPYLYRYIIATSSDKKEGKIGFKNIELTMGDGEWGKPTEYPMSRSNPPICILLNGKNIFAKGSNFVTPEVFSGKTTKQRYAELLNMVKEANMNMLRMWGGCGIQKESFYDICDELGIMVWQEFPLACNEYGLYNKEHYLKVLEKEATSIIKLIRKHVSLCLWCGGNELFNCWSCMTEQSAPLRLLDSLCYSLSPEIPFIMTAPLSGMKHGPYHFCGEDYEEVFQLFQNTEATAYTEFGVKSVATPEFLRTFMTEEEINNRKPYKNSPWIIHHALPASCHENDEVYGMMLNRFKLKKDTIEDVYQSSMWLQGEGLKAIFEEARRQWPTCSMAANWMFNEPWKVACGWSLVLYPNIKKESFYSVKDALRPILVSARIPKFAWKSGENFSAEIWLLNDCYKEVSDRVNIYLTIGGQKYLLSSWEFSEETENKLGPVVNFKLPDIDTDHIILSVETQNNAEFVSSYKLRYYPTKIEEEYKHFLDVDSEVSFFM